MRMRKHVRPRLLLVFVASLAMGTAGCGNKTSADGTTAEVNPKLAEHHKNQLEAMKNKQEPGVNNKTMRNHP